VSFSYPIALDLAGRAVVVIGGGAVAQRKVEGLGAAGARVTVIAPELTSALGDLVRAQVFVHVRREYRDGDLEGQDLAFVAVGDPAVGDAVVGEARRRRVWVNAADDPARCDFVLPSLLRRGALIVAVTTSGTCPALARAVRERLAAVVTEEYGELAAVVADVRRELRQQGASPEAEVWRRAIDDELPRLIREGRQADARRRLRERLGAT
jgi:siroheme synthase-like protein